MAPPAAAKKTATKTATPSPRSGKALPVGAHPGNTGGKKGRSGRRPDEFKEFMRRLVSRKDVCASLAKVLKNPAHPHFAQAFKMAAEFAYGKATQPVDMRNLTLEEALRKRHERRLASADS